MMRSKEEYDDGKGERNSRETYYIHLMPCYSWGPSGVLLGSLALPDIYQ